MKRGGGRAGRASRAWWLVGAQLVVCLLLVAGCYESHRLGESDMGSPRDAGASEDAGSPLDLADAELDGSLDAALERDAGIGCAPAGTYEVPVSVESMTPEGCADAPETIPVVFPFERAFVEGCGGAGSSLVPMGDCRWSFSCALPSPLPGSSYEGEGVIGVGPDGVFGRVHEVWESDSGSACDVTTILGDGPPP